MKSLALGLITALLLAGTGYAAQSGKNFTGEIMDSACAKSGSHAGMQKADPKMSTAKLCTEGCVAHGAKYVLYDDATKMTYELNDQSQTAALMGRIARTEDNGDIKAVLNLALGRGHSAIVLWQKSRVKKGCSASQASLDS